MVAIVELVALWSSPLARHYNHHAEECVLETRMAFLLTLTRVFGLAVACQQVLCSFYTRQVPGPVQICHPIQVGGCPLR